MHLRRYQPMDHPGLFLDLASVEKSPGSIIAFANQYGDLWQEFSPRSPVKAWIKAIEEMQPFVERVGTGGDQLENALWLKDRAHEALQQPTEMRIGADGLYLSPCTLWGALWIQAMNASIANTGFVRCHQCKKHIPISKKMRPGPRTFCSDKCRYDNFAARKDEALTLLAQGKSVAQAAELVGSDVRTVTGWALAGIDVSSKRPLSTDTNEARKTKEGGKRK